MKLERKKLPRKMKFAKDYSCAQSNDGGQLRHENREGDCSFVGSGKQTVDERVCVQIGGEIGGINMRKDALKWRTAFLSVKKNGALEQRYLPRKTIEYCAFLRDDSHSLLYSANPSQYPAKPQQVIMPVTFSAEIVLTELGGVYAPDYTEIMVSVR